MPAHCTSTGKAMLAELSTEQLHKLYPQAELPGLTEQSIRSRTLLEKEIAAIHKRGYATCSEESEEGVSSVAVAFPAERSALRLAFNTAVPVGRMGRADVKRIGELLRSTVDRASELLH
jgi:DNA-binding IclR family transcriptional regulator